MDTLRANICYIAGSRTLVVGVVAQDQTNNKAAICAYVSNETDGADDMNPTLQSDPTTLEINKTK